MQVLGQFKANVQNALLAGRGACAELMSTKGLATFNFRERTRDFRSKPDLASGTTNHH
jgi:hypothetical protein